MALLGKNLQILKPVSGGYSPIIAAARSCEINIDGDQLEVSSPNDGAWQHFIAGRKGWSNISRLSVRCWHVPNRGSNGEYHRDRCSR